MYKLAWMRPAGIHFCCSKFRSFWFSCPPGCGFVESCPAVGSATWKVQKLSNARLQLLQALLALHRWSKSILQLFAHIDPGISGIRLNLYFFGCRCSRMGAKRHWHVRWLRAASRRAWRHASKLHLRRVASRCLRLFGVLDPGRCKTVPYHAGAQVHWQQFQEQCVRSHYCWHAAAWNRRVWKLWEAGKINWLNCLNSSSFLKADFCVFCFTWDLTGPTPEVCGHERKFQSSFPWVLEYPRWAGNRRCCGGAPWWCQEKRILCKSVGYPMVCQCMSRYAGNQISLISGFGCQGAPWTGQPQVRSKEGLDLRITESTGALGSSNFAYYRVMR